MRLSRTRCGHGLRMHLKRTLLAVLVTGTTLLTGCAGSNTDVQRGETNCDAGSDNSHDQNCDQTGTPNPSDNT